MSVPRHDLRRTISSLRIIFWGGLICVLDFKIHQFDLLNDFVGMIMITWGFFKIGNIEVHDRYSKAMRFIKISAVLSCFDAFLAQLPYLIPLPIYFFLSAINIASMIAIVVFCVAMRRLSEEADLPKAARTWKTTTWVSVFLYSIPIGLFHCVDAVAIAMQSPLNIELGPGCLPLPLVFFVPLMCLFLAISRMRAEAESSLVVAPSDAAFNAEPASFPARH